MLLAPAISLAILVMVGCGGSNTAPSPVINKASGSLVVFGTDQPSCDVQSFLVTISSAALVPQGGGQAATISGPSGPVDFASLVDFTSILSFGNVDTGTYESLSLTLTNPQLTVLNTSVSPPVPVTFPTCSGTVTSNCASFSNGTASDTIDILFSPPLMISADGTSGFVVDFNMRQSVQTDANGMVTGVIDPQLTVTPSTASGTTLGEADTLYGVVSTASCTTNSGFTGCFSLQVQGGVGQVLTIQVNGSTDFEGDGVTGLSTLSPNTFVEVDAIVDTSGDIIAQEVDAEEQVVTTGQEGGFLGRIIGVTRDSSGNATAFNLLVGREAWDMTSEVPLQSSLAVTVAADTKYRVNWHHWNRQSLQFGPQTLGLAESVAVYGVLTAASGSTPVTLTADHVFLRQRNVLGTFKAPLTSVTGGFTMVPCGDLFGGNTITVLTFGNSSWRGGLGGLSGLTPGPVIDVAGLVFFEQSNGPGTPPIWTASSTSPTWVVQAKAVHQLPQ
jgi:hypothetical protein